MEETELYHPKLVLAKLQPAPLQSNCIHRERLLNTLIYKEPSAKVILVQAPAGYGKSVLLTQYWQYCLEQGLETLWLTLDNADNYIERLVRHLYAGWDASPSSDNDTINFQDFLERLASCTQPVRFFFDNFETIHNPVVLKYFQQIIEYLPLNSEVIIGSSHIPDLKLGRIHSYGQLLGITQKDLLFSFTETAHFLQQTSSLMFKDKAIQVLLNKTEGWITAIQLAVSALSKHQDAELFFSTFSGSHTEVAQYLAEDILNQLSDRHRNFLLQTSILSELNASLCNYVVQTTDSETQLKVLAQNNIFIFPTDNSHRQYRYHNLFSSYLLSRLKASKPQVYSELNCRAAAWYLKKNKPIMAITHLLDNSDQQQALDLLDKHVMQFIEQGRFKRLLYWFDKFPPHSFIRYKRLQLAFGWALVLNRRHTDAKAIIAEFITDNNAADISDPMRQQARTLQCIQLSLTDEITACQKLSQQLLDEINPDQTLQYGLLVSIRAYCLVVTGEYNNARETIAYAFKRHLQLQATFSKSLCDALEGWVDITEGRLDEASLRLERYYKQVWSQNKTAIPRGKATIGVPYAELLYERDDLRRAQFVLDECLAYAEVNGTVDSLIGAYVLRSKIARASGDRQNAHRYLQELEETGARTDLIKPLISVKLEIARIHWLDGDITKAQSVLTQIVDMYESKQQTSYLWPTCDVETEDIMQWRLMIAKGHAKQAENLLRQDIKVSEAAQRFRRALKTRILLSTALMVSGKLDQAMRSFTKALQIGSHNGFIRLFLDEGDSIKDLLQVWKQKNHTQAKKLNISTDFCEHLFIAYDLKEFVVSKSSRKKDTLTKRELEILNYLARGGGTQEMAQSLFISEFTVKSHLRNINSKLGVHNRIEAVAIARGLGLLS